MAAASSDGTLKKLLEANIKTQQSVKEVVTSIKDLVAALKEAGEVEGPEIVQEEIKVKDLTKEGKEAAKAPKGDGLGVIEAKIDSLMDQHTQLIAAVNELTRILKRTAPAGGGQQPQPGTFAPPPTPPPQYRRL